ncbi:MAG: AraC family transcriptional regulator [Castellaniella sp.]|uniref:AraC family transcriptional regulator n=1 Tax=Castellaniella sp. TaxID=1955812 RepID=UPI003C72E6BC
MIDPFAEVVMLLQPEAPFSKVVSGAGAWRVSREESGQTFYCAILEGSCLIQADGHEPITLQENDFILIPSAHHFAMSSLEPPPEGMDATPVALPDGEFRLGATSAPADVRYLVGYCVFGASDAALLVSLLPRLLLARGGQRLVTLVQLVADECRARRPARDVILTRLLEVLLVEALRAGSGGIALPGLLRGLADERLSVSIRWMHEMPARSWSVDQLAKEAALSRSAFFERFNRIMGMTPMEYLLTWRMALAKNLLRRSECGLAEIAERVGYSSVNTFSVAFTRHVGLPPRRYARQNPDLSQT